MEEDINSPIVLDASAILSFIMPDERTTPAIQYIFDKLASGELQAFAPQLLPYEVVNSLKSSIKRKRISKKIAVGILERFLLLGIELENIDLKASLSLALKYDISVYDASSLTLAKSRKLKIISFDEKLMELAN